MLINKTEGRVTIVYNGKSRDLEAGEGIDIRDFDIETRHVAAVEKRIMSKYPGVYEQKSTINKDPNVNKELLSRIKELEDKNTALVKENEALRSSEKIAQEKHATSAEGIGTMRQEVASMKKEVDKYKSENEELKDEVEKLRGASRKIK